MAKKHSRERPGKAGDAFTIEEKPCVWMTAGVVNFKLCDQTCDCSECAFDKAMSRAWQEGKERFDREDD